MEQRLYESMIRPYLKKDPDGETLLYLYNQAFRAWMLGVEKEEIGNMLMIDNLCGHLYQKEEKILISLISQLWGKMHDERAITERYMRKFSSLKGVEEIGERYDIALEYYKTLFETELRMWLTIPYAYLCEFINTKSRKKDYEDYIATPTGTKRYELSALKKPTLQGDLRKLTVGFDNKIRNAGSGHNNYEVTDEGILLLHVKHRLTHKVINTIKLSEKELNTKIKLMERKLWPLEIGIIIFLVNNPEVKSKIQAKVEYKVAEIEGLLWEFVKQRQMTMKKFNFTGRKILELEINKDVTSNGKSGKLYMDGAPPSDILTDTVEVNYEDQILGIAEYALHLNQKNPFAVKVKVNDEKGACLMDLKFDEKEISKLGLEKKQKPKPSKGKICKKSYELVVEHAVPMGTKGVYEEALKIMRQQKKAR